LIPEALQRLIRDNLKSVWALELLLLMSRERARSWSADDLNRELRGSLGLVADLLAKFKQAGLVTEESGQYRYRAATAELERAVHELEAAYAARPLAVVKAVLAAPNEKIQTFADAFKVKKD
jgi:hypothetical protein